MNSRENFVKGELNNFYGELRNICDYCPYSQLEDNKRFDEIFKVLFENNNLKNKRKA